MPFFDLNRRDPVTLILIAAAVLITVGIGVALLRMSDRYNSLHQVEAEIQTPAGVAEAELTSGELDIIGWSPEGASIQILDRGKILAASSADGQGIWRLGIPYQKRSKPLQSMLMTYQEKGKEPATIADFNIFTMGRTTDDAYVWAQHEYGPDLLQTPFPEKDNDLFLVMVFGQDGKPLTFTGHGTSNALVQIYNDDELQGTAAINAAGYWRLRSPLIAGKETLSLRFDVVHGDHTIERRSYNFDWPGGLDVSSEPAKVKDGWLVAKNNGDTKEVIYVLKPEAGETLAAGETIAGQVIPLPVPSDVKDKYR